MPGHSDIILEIHRERLLGEQSDMNKRMMSVIQELSRPEQQVSLADLAETYEISQRTVRNDLNAINDLLQEHGLAAVQLQKGGQIIREPDFQELLIYLDQKDFYDYKLNKEERKKIAALLLTQASGFVTLFDLAEHMAVSRATVIHDLDEIKSYISTAHLQVRSHPNKGLRVEGRESDKRLFLIRLMDGHSLLTDDKIIKNQIEIESETEQVLQKILYEQEHVHESFLTDSSFRKILLYLEILLTRISAGEYIEIRSRTRNSKQPMAQDLLKYVGQYCHLHVTEDEIQFLSELLSFCHYMKQKSADADAVRSQMTARHFIEKLSEQLGSALNQDFDLFENLSNHLESAFSASQSDQELNPVVEHVLAENPEIREAVEKALPVIEEYAGRSVSETEVGYLAVHVCAAMEREKNKEIAFHVIVACHAGVGTSHLLLEKLKKHFNFSIVDIVSSHEAANLQTGQADFVISTVELKACQLETITVSPLLRDEDYIQIGNLVDRLRTERNFPSGKQVKKRERKQTVDELMRRITPVLKEAVPEQAEALTEKIGAVVAAYFQEGAITKKEESAPTLQQLLTSAHIQLDILCTDWRQAIRASAEQLLAEEYFNEQYVNAMIRNVEENGPYIVISKGFAFPHEGIDQGTKKLGMNLIRLKTPVLFDAEERDPVEFVCCLSAVDQKTHLKAFFHLVNILKNEDFKMELRTCRTPEEAAAIIRRYEWITEEE